MPKLSVAHQELLSLNIEAADRSVTDLQAAGLMAVLAAKLQFQIDWQGAADDPRELSEIPEVRLWFIRLDAKYPWLPLALDWQSGELTRYAAMLVPHTFNRQTGILYNPEALEIWVMNKIFTTTTWLHQQGSNDYQPVKFMAKTLGYELDRGLFDLITPTS
jgi:hypothetical protein